PVFNRMSIVVRRHPVENDERIVIACSRRHVRRRMYVELLSGNSNTPYRIAWLSYIYRWRLTLVINTDLGVVRRNIGDDQARIFIQRIVGRNGLIHRMIRIEGSYLSCITAWGRRLTVAKL